MKLNQAQVIRREQCRRILRKIETLEVGLLRGLVLAHCKGFTLGRHFAGIPARAKHNAAKKDIPSGASLHVHCASAIMEELNPGERNTVLALQAVQLRACVEKYCRNYMLHAQASADTCHALSAEISRGRNGAHEARSATFKQVQALISKYLSAEYVENGDVSDFTKAFQVLAELNTRKVEAYE
jgi:hypothetical protein